MLSIQHLLCARLQNTNYTNLETNSEYMAALIFPDAIRKYSGARQYTHFEKSSDGTNDSSYWEFPSVMNQHSEEDLLIDTERE